MKILETVAEVRAWRTEVAGEIALVPTMGALHEGHLELIRQAKRLAPKVITSIFVNPTQFGPGEDFERYPRQLQEDSKLCESAGATAIFTPSVEEMYGGPSVIVQVLDASQRFEGEIRPNHFSGVATVVTKLLNICQPNFAVFGWKDLQQCAVIEQLVAGLSVPVELKFIETVREPSGLARSSRNEYLTPEARAKAALVFHSLSSLAELLRQGGALRPLLHQQSEFLKQNGFKVDYFELVNPTTMKPTESLVGSRLVIAVRLENVRLLDNIPVFS